MDYWRNKRAVVTGGSAGLGQAIATTLVQNGARVMVVARREAALADTAQHLRALGGDVTTLAADVTKQDDVKRLAAVVQSSWGGLDMLCHAAGRSMRGTALGTSIDDYRDLWETNFLSAVRLAQQFATPLTTSRGHLVLIGSLASKAAAKYLGAYPTSKFPLAAFAQQLRLENGEAGLHSLLVCPGPIARLDGEPNVSRYAHQSSDLPAEADRPGGGAKLRAIDPQVLAQRILRACAKRQAELVVPGRAKILFAAAQLSTRLGDWLIRRVTSS